jgi:tRNA dimethylallyltransferase
VSNKPLVIICGPTATGKTKLAVDLALAHDGEVVSADSMQVYRGMDIGTAKPTAREMQGIPHHLLNILDPDEDFSVAQYAKLARESIAEIHARGRLPILAGGTGLYISAIADNIQYADVPTDTALRERLRAEAAVSGGEAMLRRLSEADPAPAKSLHPNNLGRIIRALEVYELTGVPLSEWQEQSRTTPSNYTLCIIGLEFREREKLYERIEERVDAMFVAGLLNEAKALYDAGFTGTASQAIGYKELFGYFRGEQSPEAAAERIKRETRRYAKRQMTWFRRDGRINRLYPDDGYDNVLQQAKKLVKSL